MVVDASKVLRMRQVRLGYAVIEELDSDFFFRNKLDILHVPTVIIIDRRLQNVNITISVGTRNKVD